MDWKDACMSFSAAAGIPVNLFENGEKVYGKKYEHPEIALDMFQALPAGGDGIFYTIIMDYLFCGVIRAGNKIVAVEPVASYKCSLKTAQQLLAFIRQSILHAGGWLEYFREKPSCTLSRFLDAMRFIGMLLGIEKDKKVTFLPFVKADMQFRNIPDSQWGETSNIKDVEDRIMLYIESGDTLSMSEYLSSLQNISAAGILNDDALRSIKNTLIMTVSVITRAAVRGGLDYNTAMWVQGTYLYAVEGMCSYQEVNANISRMFMDFTSRVAEIRMFPGASPVATRACRHINANIRDKISTADVANALGYNRSYLCRIFKEETGLTITDYILQAKISTAKKLIIYTDKSLAEISNEMGFSSQNYFQSSFKKCTGETPGAYKAREKK